MHRLFFALLWVVVCGCAFQGAWQPTVSTSPGLEDGISSDAFVDGCRVEWSSLLLGIETGTLLDQDGLSIATLPGDQAVELQGSLGTTLAQVHVPAASRPTALQLELGPPQSVLSRPYEGPCPMEDCGDDGRGSADNPVRGNATAEQRAALHDAGIAGQVAGTLRCGKGTELAFQWQLSPAVVTCPVDNWELEAAHSTATWAEFAFHLLFSVTENADTETTGLRGLPWLDADLDDNGTLDASERSTVPAETIGLPGSGSLDAWIDDRARSIARIDRTTACTWTAGEN